MRKGEKRFWVSLDSEGAWHTVLCVLSLEVSRLSADCRKSGRGTSAGLGIDGKAKQKKWNYGENLQLNVVERRGLKAKEKSSGLMEWKSQEG